MLPRNLSIWKLFTDSWVDVTSINFNNKKVYEDEMFGRQDILQCFSGESMQRLQICKIPTEVIGSLIFIQPGPPEISLIVCLSRPKNIYKSRVLHCCVEYINEMVPKSFKNDNYNDNYNFLRTIIIRTIFKKNFLPYFIVFFWVRGFQSQSPVSLYAVTFYRYHLRTRPHTPLPSSVILSTVN